MDRVTMSRSDGAWGVPVCGIEHCGSQEDAESPRQRQSLVIPSPQRDPAGDLRGARRPGAGPSPESPGEDVVQLRDRGHGPGRGAAGLHRADGGEPHVAAQRRGPAVPEFPRRSAALGADADRVDPPGPGEAGAGRRTRSWSSPRRTCPATRRRSSWRSGSTRSRRSPAGSWTPPGSRGMCWPIGTGCPSRRRRSGRA